MNRFAAHSSLFSAAVGLLIAGLSTGCGPGNDGTDVVPCEASLLIGDLVITEVFADADGADEGREWFEIYNATSQAIDLKGVVLVASKSTGEDETTHVMAQQIIDPGQYLVVGSVAPEFRPIFVDYGYGNDLRVGSSRGLPNADGRLALKCDVVMVDEVTYGQMTSGKSMALDGTQAPDYQANDDQSLWCDSTTEFEAGNFGTPRAANDACSNVTPTMCNDNGTMRELVSPTVGDVVISETMAAPVTTVGSPEGEWIELAVTKDVDLNGLQLGQAEPPTEATPGPKAVKQALASADCLRVAAGSYVVVAGSTDMTANGGVTADFELSFGLTNSKDGVFIGFDDQILDVVTWASSKTGTARSLDKDSLDPTTNDEDRFWCDAVDSYGADGMTGTPGAENPSCDIPPPDAMCFNGVGVLRAIVKPAMGDIIINEWMASAGVATDANGEYVELKANASFDLNGLQMGQAETTGPKPVRQTIASSACLPVVADDLILLVRNNDPTVNGGIPAADIDFILEFGLTNSNDGLFIGIDDTVLDTRTWVSSIPSGVSEQVDPAMPANLCQPTVTYGGPMGDRGTPGTVNICP